MAIELDKEGKVQLQKILGKRLRAARKAARMSDLEVAKIVGHKELTQVSLWESGDRMPPHHTLVKLAIAFAVSTDYLYGIHNDPIADPTETNQGVIVNAISSSMAGCFEKFTAAISEHAAVTIAGFGTDRSQLRSMCEAALGLEAALDRFKELNPHFEEDMRGSARLATLVASMVKMGGEFERRLNWERQSIEVIDREIRVAEMHENAEQFMLSFVN